LLFPKKHYLCTFFLELLEQGAKTGSACFNLNFEFMNFWNYEIFYVVFASLLRGGAFCLHKNTTKSVPKVW
jgi:hypothetical protein